MLAEAAAAHDVRSGNPGVDAQRHVVDISDLGLVVCELAYRLRRVPELLGLPQPPPPDGLIAWSRTAHLSRSASTSRNSPRLEPSSGMPSCKTS
jgi:hypothetical protein